MCKAIFLGTGGGRINLIRQLRGTGGFLIKGRGIQIHVDPGPGALAKLNWLKISPEGIDALIATHMHIDHVLEAPLLIEAMCGHMLERGGTLIASAQVLRGDKNGDRSISLYHQSKLLQNIAFGPGGGREIKIAGKGSFKIRGIGVKHDDWSGFGFVMEIGGRKIGYTSDTEYLPQIHNKAYAGVDLLIANCLKPHEDEIPDHLHSGDLAKLLLAAKPRACIISHMGMKILQSGPEQQAAKLQSESGVKTIAARDGYCYDLKSGRWAKYSQPKRGGKFQKRL